MPNSTQREKPDVTVVWLRWAIVILIALHADWIVAPLAWAGQIFQVEQKGRMFNPGTLEIHKGDTVRIVNNDGDLLHHAYVASPAYNFDSGEQEPGGSVDIVFTQTGTYQILCGIHPKMRVDVTVK